MAETSIEWTDSSWNPVAGCTWASPGCDHCYAARMTRRLEAMGQAKYAGLTTHKHFNGTIRTVEDDLTIPLRWRKPRRIFVNSMSDLFHKDVPFEFIDDVFAVMYDCHWHTFQVLTKRPDRMAEYLSDPDLPARIACSALRLFQERQPEKYSDGLLSNADVLDDVRGSWPLPNVWAGTSVEDQPRADERIPYLLHCPAAVRFLSVEPLLGPVDLTTVKWQGWWDALSSKCVSWVIVGGESGSGARPMHPDWVRSIRDQCAAAAVPFFFKQWGAWVPYEPDAQPPFWSGQDGNMIDGHALPDLTDHEPVGEWFAPGLDGVIYRRVGKKAAGRLLDCREWQEFPQTTGAMV